LARSAGVRTILNPAPVRPIPSELLALTDLCIPNETELQTITNKSFQTTEELVAVAQSLREAGPRTVLVTLGETGAFLLDQGLIPTPRVQAVDPTAAGDAFIGGLAVFLAGGMPLVEAARRACCVAALTVTRHGAQSSFPSKAEIDAFFSGRSLDVGLGGN
jgi:ribokinase